MPSSSKMVGIALATSVGAEEITTAIAKALAAKGITNVVVSLVQSAYVLPYLAKQMAEKCAVVLAVGVLTDDDVFASEILIEALISTGLAQKCPTVPVIIAPKGMLELKSSLSHHCPAWANSVSSLLALGIVAPVAVSSLEVKTTSNTTSQSMNARFSTLIIKSYHAAIIRSPLLLSRRSLPPNLPCPDPPLPTTDAPPEVLPLSSSDKATSPCPSFDDLRIGENQCRREAHDSISYFHDGNKK